MFSHFIRIVIAVAIITAAIFIGAGKVQASERHDVFIPMVASHIVESVDSGPMKKGEALTVLAIAYDVYEDSSATWSVTLTDGVNVWDFYVLGVDTTHEDSWIAPKRNSTVYMESLPSLCDGILTRCDTATMFFDHEAVTVVLYNWR